MRAAGRSWAALAVLLIPSGLMAQTATITGTVRSQSQLPVGGAYVAIPGVQAAAMTNDMGAYQLVIPAGRVQGQQETLVVRQIGYRAQEVTVTLTAGVQQRDFVLQEEAVVLDGVVVTGTAGRQERKAQPAVVASVDAARVAQVAPVTSVSNLLQSRMAGVSVQQTSGTTGTAQTIRIRGAASISLSNEPLVFIDGVRADSRNRQIYGVGGQAGSRLNDLRPEDIESIEVVKGPAAATLYGADASAGVIQIITKKGRANGGFTQSLSVEYNRFDSQWDPPSNFGACSATDVGNANSTLCYQQPVGTIISDNPLKREDVLKTGQMRSLSWSGRGGGENYGFFVSLGRDQEDGMLPNNSFGRMSGRVNFDFIPSDKIRVEAGFGLIRSETRLPNNDNNIYGFLTGAMMGRPQTVGGANNGWYAPNRHAEQLGQLVNEDVSVRVQPRVSVKYNPTDWFSHRLTLGADLTRSEAMYLYPKNNSSWWGTANYNSGQTGAAREHSDRVTMDYLGNITRHLSDDISADISFGAQLISTRADLTYATGIGLITNVARAIDAAATRTGGQSFSESRQAGVLGQLQLSMWDRLFVQTGARLDKHSSFGRDAKAFLSPKVGVSYVISEESFWKENVPGFIGTVRLRGAYGTTGRSPSSGALATYDPAPYALSATSTGGGVIPLNSGNPNLRPERGTEIEAGFEAGLFADLLGLEVTYFNKVTKDAILSRELPPSMGFSQNVLVNIGSVVNRGFEVAANANLITRPNFAWTARAAFNTLHNEITDMGDIPAFNSFYRRREGAQIGAFHTHRIQRYETYAPNAAKPDSLALRAVVSDTLEFVGNLLPTFEGNLSSTFTLFGNVQLYAQLDRKSDFYIYNNTAQFRERQQRIAENWIRRDELLSDQEQVRRFGPFVNSKGETVDYGNVREAYIEPGDFWRLREVALTYNIPRGVANRFGAAAASLTLAGRDLALWTKYSGVDPEVNTDTGGFAREEFLTMPKPRRFVARVNLQF